MRTSFEQSAVDASALVFRVHDTEHARRTLKEFSYSPPAPTGLGAVDSYVRRYPGARLMSLGARLPNAMPLACGFGMPAATGCGRDLATVHYLRLQSPEDAPDLIRALRDDPHVEYVHHPAIQTPIVAPVDSARMADATADALGATAPVVRQWALRACGFPDVWDALEQGPDPGPIAVIDMGSVAHDDLLGRVQVIREPRYQPSRASHAMEVSGVLGAIRGDENGQGMSGCCSAEIHYFNIFTEDRGFDSESLYHALVDVAARAYPVLNLSFGSPDQDETLARGIRDCVAAGVVVVAAMGDDATGGDSPLFPAALPEVIAVGGTDQFDNKQPNSKTGRHIWISAPADRIWTLADGNTYAFQAGTSFATAMVSAAVWLGRRARPSLTPSQTRDLLSHSVRATSAPPARNDQIGFGRLDMLQLAKLVQPGT